MSAATHLIERTEHHPETVLTCDGCGRAEPTVDDIAPANWIGAGPVGDVQVKCKPSHHFCSRTCLIGHYAPIQAVQETSS